MIKAAGNVLRWYNTYEQLMIDSETVDELETWEVVQIRDPEHSVASQPKIPPPWASTWAEHTKAIWLHKMWRGLSAEAGRHGIARLGEFDEEGVLVGTGRLERMHKRLESMWNKDSVPLWVQWVREPRDGKLFWDIASDVDIAMKKLKESEMSAKEEDEDWTLVDCAITDNNTSLLNMAKEVIRYNFRTRIPEVSLEGIKDRLKRYAPT